MYVKDNFFSRHDAVSQINKNIIQHFWHERQWSVIINPLHVWLYKRSAASEYAFMCRRCFYYYTVYYWNSIAYIILLNYSPMVVIIAEVVNKQNLLQYNDFQKYCGNYGTLVLKLETHNSITYSPRVQHLIITVSNAWVKSTRKF